MLIKTALLNSARMRKAAVVEDRELKAKRTTTAQKQPAAQPTLDGPRIGARLKHARLVNHMRLKDVAESAGCSESMLSKIENERAIPSLTTLHRLCKALNLSVSTLL